MYTVLYCIVYFIQICRTAVDLGFLIGFRSSKSFNTEIYLAPIFLLFGYLRSQKPEFQSLNFAVYVLSGLRSYRTAWAMQPGGPVQP
jgi:hypothetical protein